MTATYGAIVGYLAGHPPKQLKDYFFPVVDDQGNRVSLPSYMKDVYAWQHDPLTAAGHKANPVLSTLVDMLQNRDFFGTEIRNSDDPILQQFLETTGYLTKQYEPFSVRNLVEQRKRLGGVRAQFGSFVGVTPAPAYISNSDATNKAIEYMRQNRGQGTRTKEQAEASEKRRLMADRIRQGEKLDLGAEIRAGRLSQKDAKSIETTAKESKLVRMSKSLPIEQLLKVAELATPEERQELRPILERRSQSLARSHSPEETQELQERIQKLLASSGKPRSAGVIGKLLTRRATTATAQP